MWNKIYQLNEFDDARISAKILRIKIKILTNTSRLGFHFDGHARLTVFWCTAFHIDYLIIRCWWTLNCVWVRHFPIVWVLISEKNMKINWICGCENKTLNGYWTRRKFSSYTFKGNYTLLWKGTKQLKLEK
mgnify:CR=1 FL=1